MAVGLLAKINYDGDVSPPLGKTIISAMWLKSQMQTVRNLSHPQNTSTIKFDLFSLKIMSINKYMVGPNRHKVSLRL